MVEPRETAATEEGASGGAKETMKEGARQAQEKASEMASEAREQTRHLSEEGREKAEELARRAEHRARSRAEEEKTRVATGIRTVADSIRQSARDLPEDQRSYGRVLGTVADRAEGVSRYLEDHEVDDMAREAKRFARENTAVVLSGAFALGMMGARFLKGSSDKARGDSAYQGDMREQGEMYRGEIGYRGDAGRYASESYPRQDAGVDPMEEPLVYGRDDVDDDRSDAGGYSHGEVRTAGGRTRGSTMGGADA